MESQDNAPSYAGAKMEYVHAIYNHSVDGFYRVVAGYFRRKRHKGLASEFRDCRTVLDLGGTAEMWNTLSFGESITLLNIGYPPPGLDSKFTYIKGDARDTGLPDLSFDLVFSNSAIEHVGGLEDQRRFANEMLRLGRRIYCQTPYRWFPIEPHFMALFVHWLPRRWFTAFIYRYFTLNGWIARPEPERCAELAASVRLLTRRELAELFPGCRIMRERFLGFTKSLIVIK
jgi:hypothetical protein